MGIPKEKMAQIQSIDLKTIPYDKALQEMMARHEDCVEGRSPDTIFVLEHTPVITKGRRLHGKAIPNEDSIKENGIAVFEADRGGLLTYHGPGQVVVYFVLHVNDHFKGVNEMVHSIEDMLLSFLKQHNIIGTTDPDNPGIWIEGKKIASIGLRVNRGVSRHGISLNINNDLSVYQLFDPCGMSGNLMTNMAQYLGRKIEQAELIQIKKKLEDFILSQLTKQS